MKLYNARIQAKEALQQKRRKNMKKTQTLLKKKH
jgi:hypothetical protein